MAKIIIAGDAVVVESAFTLEEIKTLEKYRPNALVLFEADGKTERFKVNTNSVGSISQYGVSFNSSSKNEGHKAIVTLGLSPSVEDVTAYVENVIGVSILYLNEVERQFADALAEVSEEKARIRDSITIL